MSKFALDLDTDTTRFHVDILQWPHCDVILVAVEDRFLCLFRGESHSL